MPLAWFICPYKRDPSAASPRVRRYCSIADANESIVADGGAWAETEILGDAALVKVRASNATLAQVNQLAGVVRIPNHTALTDTLGDLTAGQRNAILTKLLTLGYAQQEIAAALPADWTAVTLGQVLRFAATRRLKPRYDAALDRIVLDGAVQPVRPVADVDAAVQAQQK